MQASGTASRRRPGATRRRLHPGRARRAPPRPRQAGREEEIVCLECGRAFVQLTNTHLLSRGLTSFDYKREDGYNSGRALMYHALRRVYAARAVDSARLADARALE